MILHRIFISYHHENDQKFKEELVEIYNSVSFIDCSVEIGDIDENLLDETIRQKIRDEYLRNSTVTIVLLGEETHRRKHIDWEISSSIINSKLNSRSGLLGILLPSHPAYDQWNRIQMSKENIQKRFWDNYQTGYATLIWWDKLSKSSLSNAIEIAFENRENKEYNNSESLRRNNS